MPTLDEVGATVSWGDEQRKVYYEGVYDPEEGVGGLNVYMEAPRRPCSEDPERLILGDLMLNTMPHWIGLTDAPLDELLRPIITLFLADAIHEMTEYVRIDGERVFDPHPGGKGPGSPGEKTMWDLILRVASNAADELIEHHPRNERTMK